MRPLEVFRAESGKWLWRCHCCGMLCGGWRRTWSSALNAGLSHLSAVTR